MPNKQGKLTENEIQAQIKQILQMHGFFVIRIQQGLGCHKGISDLIACKDGKVYFLEVKTPRGRLSEYQERFRDDLHRQGCNYYVLRSIDDAMNLLMIHKWAQL